jgi:phenylalanine-4-hydroxylase
LKQFIKPQDYSDYTPINQAVWRYVMRKTWITFESGTQFLSRWFEENGIEIDNIPSMYGMNRILTDSWWAFSLQGWPWFHEFQAYNVWLSLLANALKDTDNFLVTFTNP